jgi:hypothetical protein
VSTAVVRVDGLRELSAALQRMPAKIGKNVLGAALRAGAREIQRPAQRAARALNRTPVANRPKHRPVAGTLAKSVVVVRDRRNQLSASEPAVMIWVAKGKKYSKKGRDAYYSPWVELGHKIVPRAARGAPPSTGERVVVYQNRRGTTIRRRLKFARLGLRQRRKDATKRVPAYPFLGPAAEQNYQRALRTVADHARRSMARKGFL